MEEEERLVRHLESIGQDIGDLFRKGANFEGITNKSLRETISWVRERMSRMEEVLRSLENHLS